MSYCHRFISTFMNLIYSTQFRHKKKKLVCTIPKLPPNMSKGPYQQYVTKRINIQCPWVTHDMCGWDYQVPTYSWNIIKRLNELYEMDGLCKTYNNPSIPPPLIRSPHIYSHSITYFMIHPLRTINAIRKEHIL